MASLVTFRTRYLLLSRADVVYNPYTHLEGQIKAASKTLAGYFGEVDSALDDGDTVAHAVHGRKQIEKSMRLLIQSARLQGFQLGSKVSKKQMPADYGKTLWDKAGRRASNVDRLMSRTTRHVLKSTPDSDYVLGPERSQMAARYEASRAYFRGLQDSLGGSGTKKAWITSSEEPCDDCNSNEGQGYIDIDDDFDSGDPFPPPHQNCMCSIAVRR